MSAAAPSPWTAQQRRWLQALGHVVLRNRDGGAEAEAEAEAVPAPVVPPLATGTGPVAPIPPASTPGPRPSAALAGTVARPAPAPMPDADAGSAPASAAGRTGAMRRPAQMPDRLRLALLRASGLDPADPVAQEAMAQWPVERLRNDAAAKRAFWPQLRALRKRPS